MQHGGDLLRVDRRGDLCRAFEHRRGMERRRAGETPDQFRALGARILIPDAKRHVLDVVGRGIGEHNDLQQRRNQDDEPGLTVLPQPGQFLDQQCEDASQHLSRAAAG